MAAEGVVVDAAKRNRIVGEKRAILAEASAADNGNGVVRRRHDGSRAKRLALGMRHEIRAVAQVSRAEISARLVGRVHEDVVAIQLHGDDRVVEKWRRNLVVHLRGTDADEDGIRLEARDPEHGDEQRRLVAAYAVAVVEGEVNVVRRVARRRVLHREAHVADLLRDELVHRAHLVDWRGICTDAPHDFLDLVRHRGVRLFKVGNRDIPVPLRELLPVGRRGDAQVLALRPVGRHRRLGEHLRRVLDRPAVDDAIAVSDDGRDDIAKRIAHGDVLERARNGTVDPDGRADYRHRRLEDLHVGPLVLDAAFRHYAARLDVERLANLDSGNGARENFVERVVDIRGGRGVVGRLLQRRGEVDGAGLALGVDDFDEEYLALPVAKRVFNRQR